LQEWFFQEMDEKETYYYTGKLDLDRLISFGSTFAWPSWRAERRFEKKTFRKSRQLIKPEQPF
jgi:hypothetical protein